MVSTSSSGTVTHTYRTPSLYIYSLGASFVVSLVEIPNAALRFSPIDDHPRKFSAYPEWTVTCAAMEPGQMRVWVTQNEHGTSVALNSRIWRGWWVWTYNLPMRATDSRWVSGVTVGSKGGKGVRWSSAFSRTLMGCGAL